jgi:hypothetical protein
MKVSKRKSREIGVLADASYEALLEVAKASSSRQTRRREAKATVAKTD